MRSSYKKICLLFCGTVFNPKHDDIGTWLGKMPELGVIADISPFFIFGESTANSTPTTWIKLAQEIYKKYDEFDGFVVVHDLDNILYTSSAISFLLQDLGKPVIFTGRQSEKVAFRDSGIKANLINSCQVATYDIAEVALMFGNRLFRANCAVPNTTSQLNIFAAPDFGLLGQIDFSVRVLGRAKKRADKKPKLFKALETNIEIIKAHPFMTADDYAVRIKNRAGLLLDVRETNLSETCTKVLKNAPKDFPCVVVGAASATIEKDNILFVSGMTREAVATKFAWAMAQSRDINYIRTIMTQNVSGELS